MNQQAAPVAQQLREGCLWQPIDNRRIRCLACADRCPIFDGLSGVCKVRINRGGKLYVPWGYVAALQCDPIEKKPFFHVLPGAAAMSFGMLGCNLHCPWCQNWITSQAFRDSHAAAEAWRTEPAQIVQAAKSFGAPVVVSTYNEPLITAEWAVAIFEQAHAAGLLTGIVTNGAATPEVLAYMKPSLDLIKVDLKCFNDRSYRQLGGRLAPVLDGIQRVHSMGFWLEVVTLVVPGFNDSDEELGHIASFLKSLSSDIPWHVTAFHGDYRVKDRGPTPLATLTRAARIGTSAGLHYVYAGNVPGLNQLETTSCPACQTILVRRRGYTIREYNVTSSGSCPGCGLSIPGRWIPPAAPKENS